MNSNSGEDELPTSIGVEEAESPRKRARMDNPGRKSWSLMDRKADHEILQEMGVSLLEPDDSEGLFETGNTGLVHHKTSKRKRDIENVNPNINSVTSPRSKYSPRSPKVRCSPGAGPSKPKSPKSTEKLKPLQQTEQHLLETTLLDEYLIEEETPLAQSVSAEYLPPGPGFSAGSTGGKANSHSRFTSLGLEEELIISRRHKSEPVGVDSFNSLSDEMILSVFRWLPKRTLVHSMMVCKRWYRVACDETLWQRLDLGNKTLSKDALGRILARKPIIIRLASSEIGEWRPTTSTDVSRIQFLDLSMATIDVTSLNNLLQRCPGLKKLSLENVHIDNTSCELIARCSNLETLNLSMAQGVTPEGLKLILKGCPNIQALNISWCKLSEESLEIVVTMLPQRLQRLNIGGARVMTDELVERLAQRCRRVLELDLSDCPQLGGAAAAALQRLARLEHLALSRCYLLPAHALTKLKSMPALQYLEVWGMLQSQSIMALRSALPAIQINQYMFSAIARPTVGTRRTSIWGLRTRD